VSAHDRNRPWGLLRHGRIWCKQSPLPQNRRYLFADLVSTAIFTGNGASVTRGVAPQEQTESFSAVRHFIPLLLESLDNMVIERRRSLTEKRTTPPALRCAIAFRGAYSTPLRLCIRIVTTAPGIIMPAATLSIEVNKDRVRMR